jgi:hypothetical protein
MHEDCFFTFRGHLIEVPLHLMFILILHLNQFRNLQYQTGVYFAPMRLPHGLRYLVPIESCVFPVRIFCKSRIKDLDIA